MAADSNKGRVRGKRVGARQGESQVVAGELAAVDADRQIEQRLADRVNGRVSADRDAAGSTESGAAQAVESAGSFGTSDLVADAAIVADGTDSLSEFARGWAAQTQGWQFAQAAPAAASDASSGGASAGGGSGLFGSGMGLGSLFGVIGGVGLIAGGAGGSSSAGAAPQPVTTTPIEVINGYISGAKVGQDRNGNGKLDADEVQGTTDEQGRVTLKVDPAGGVIRTEGGTDLSTGKPVTNSFSAPAQSTVVSPISTVIAAAVASGESLSKAVAAVRTAFGIDADVDLLNLDPVETALGSGAPSDQAMKVKAAAVQISNTLDLGASVLSEGGTAVENSGRMADALAKAILASGGAPVNLASSNTLGTVIGNALGSSTLSGAAREKAQAAVSTAAYLAANANAVVAEAVNAPDHKEALTVIARAQRVAQVEASDALGQAIRTGGSLGDVVSQYTGSEFANKASQVTEGVISPSVAMVDVAVLPTTVAPPAGSNFTSGSVPSAATLVPIGSVATAGLTAGRSGEFSVKFSSAPASLSAANFEVGSGLTVSRVEKLTDTRYVVTVDAAADAIGSRSVKLAAGWAGQTSTGDEVMVKVNPPFSAMRFDESAAKVLPFEGAVAEVVKLFDGNSVMRFAKPLSAKPYAGTSVALTSADTLGTIDMSAGNTKLGMWVHAPQADLPIRLQLASSDVGTVSRYTQAGQPQVVDDRKFVETEVRTTKAGWQWMEFDFNQPVERWVGVYETEIKVALDPALRYDRVSVFPDFNAAPTGASFYFDSLTRGGTPPAMPAEPPTKFATLDFEGEASSYRQAVFGGASSTLVADPEDASNVVVKVTKASDAEFYAGVTLSTLPGDANAIPAIPFESGTVMTAAVYSPAPGTKVRLKAESASDSTISVETESVTRFSGWETVRFDFSKQVAGTAALDVSKQYNKLSTFFDFNVAASNGSSYLIDDIRFLGAAPAAPGNPIPAGYTLAFEDNFDSASKTSPNPAVWKFDLGDGSKKDIPGWGNGEEQYYTADLDNVFVEGGNLHIVAKANDTATNTADRINASGAVAPFTTGITSARLTTQGQNLAPYGYVEVRAKLPAEQGAWPAIWMLGEQGTWPQSGEIDIVEWSGRYFNDTTVQAALHTGQSYGNTVNKGSTTLDSTVERFHTYQLWWSPTEIRIGVDGDANSAYYRYLKDPAAGVGQWPFDSSFYLLLNVAVGGTLGGDGFAQALSQAPYEMVVDYVKVYQGASAPSAPSAAPAVPTQQQANVKSLFSDTYTAAVGATWSTTWDAVTGPESVVLGGNEVKKYSNLDFLGIEPSSPLNVAAMDTFHIDVWRSNGAADFKIKLVDFGANGAYDGGDNKEHEIVFNATNGNAIAANEWVSLDIPLSQFSGLTTKEHLAQLILASTVTGTNGQPAGSNESIWIDNVYFSKAVTTPSAPSAAPAVPTQQQANVKSLFSDTYTAAVGATWSTTWDAVTGPESVVLGGNEVKKYSNLDFLGIEPSSPLNVAAMDTFHIDVWRSNGAADFKIKLVDFGANGAYDGGDNKEHEIVFNATNGNAIAANEWVSLDIPLSQFSGLTTKEHLAQLILASTVTGTNGQPAGSNESIWIDNVYFSKAVTTPSAPSAAPAVPTQQQANVKSLFSDTYTAAVGATWSTTWDAVTGPESVVLGGNEVKKYSNLDFLGIEPSSPLNVAAMDTFHIDVWRSNGAADFKIKLVDFGANGAYDGGDNKEHEIVFNATNGNAIAANEWVSLDIPLSQFSGLTTKEHLAQLILASTVTGTNGQPAGSNESIWIDNVYFSKAVTTPSAPSAAPAVPTQQQANVKSLFSDTYTAAVGATWSTTWDAVTGPESVVLGGNEVKKYSNLDFLGIEPSSPLNVAAMDTFHIDVWRSNGAADFKIKLVDFGANGAYDGGDNKEHEIVFNATNGNAIAANEWVSLDIPLSQFSGLTTKEHLAQLILASTVTGTNGQPAGSNESIWIDNVYFSKAVTTPSAPSAAPAVPTQQQANVKSLFSDTYTAAVGATWSTTWDAVTGPESVVLGGNEVKKYSNLDFLGIEPSSPLNVAAMDTFHIDVWRSNGAADFKIKLVDFGANGAYDGGDNKEHEIVFNATNGNAIAANEWVSLDIPLSQFSGLTTKEHLAQLILASTVTGTNGQPAGSNESIWIDNVYFSKAVTTPSAPSAAPAVPTQQQANVKSLFSDTYTAAVGATWSTTWDAVTGPESVVLGGNEVKKYSNLDFLGIEPSSPLNVAAMDTFHIDVWRSNGAADFKIKLVDFGANGAYDGGDNKEHEIVFNATNGNAIAANEWVSLDIPLSQFSGLTTKEHLAQLILASTVTGTNGQPAGSNESIWIDNVYFSKAVTTPSAPSAAPAVPTQQQANVKSLFSDTYTAAVGATWSTTWDAVTGPESVVLGGNEVKKYSNLDFLGIEPSSPLNVAAMDTFHIDVWRSNGAADFKIKLVDFGANGAYDGGDNKEHEIVFNATNGNAIAANEWVSLDIPLSQFSGLTTKEHLAQLILASTVTGTNGQPAGSNESIWIDNVYFSKAASTPVL